jgi:hypothetical protein
MFKVQLINLVSGEISTPTVRPQVFPIGIPGGSDLVYVVVELMELLKILSREGSMESINGVIQIKDIFYRS